MKLFNKIAFIIVARSLAAFITILVVNFFWLLPLLAKAIDTHQSSPMGIIIGSTVILSLSILAISGILLFVLYRYIVMPINALVKAVNAASKGNVPLPLPVTGENEIGQLTRAFNHILERLAQEKELARINAQELARKVTALDNMQRKTSILLKGLQADEVQLEEAKAKDEAILSDIGDGVFAIDTSEHIILFNEAAGEISGYDPEEAIGKPYKDVLRFINEKTNVVSDSFIKNAFSGKRAEMEENTVLIHKHGEKIPVADSAAPIRDTQGKVQGVVVVFKDVTKEKELAKLKDELLSVASHELRTPMSAIKGLVSMIFDGDYGPVNDNLKQPLTDIATSTERLIGLVKDMLNVSRIEAGRIKVILSDVDINSVIEDVVESLLPIASEKHITIEVKNEARTHVQADTDGVKEILNNLIGNALKFTDKGKVTISTHDEKNTVKVTIADTGIGIATSDQDKLFGKFQQINSKEGRPAGTGLGLYIARQIARKMGGDMWLADSEVTKGSTFAFTLPYATSDRAKYIKKNITAEVSVHSEMSV